MLAGGQPMDRFAAWIIGLIILISLGEGIGFLIASL